MARPHWVSRVRERKFSILVELGHVELGRVLQLLVLVLVLVAGAALLLLQLLLVRLRVLVVHVINFVAEPDERLVREPVSEAVTA